METALLVCCTFSQCWRRLPAGFVTKSCKFSIRRNCVFGSDYTHIKPHDLSVLGNLPWHIKISFMLQMVLWGDTCCHCFFMPGETDPFVVLGHKLLKADSPPPECFPKRWWVLSLFDIWTVLWLTLFVVALPGPGAAKSTPSQPGGEGLCKSLPQLHLRVHFQQLSWAVQSGVPDRSCE